MPRGVHPAILPANRRVVILAADRFGSVTKSIAVYFLGGTISMTPGASGALARLDGAALVASVPALAELDVDLQVYDPLAVPSAALTFDDIAGVVASAKVSAADGVVIVQGTDTIEETAFLVDLLWDRDAPVVVTGAMRTPAAAGADGPANLLGAVIVAAARQFRGQGAFVVFADQVHAARRVRKAHTTSVSAFTSPDSGPVGAVVEGEAILLASVPRLPAVTTVRELSSRVPVVSVAMDDGGELLPAAERCDGVVVAGLGAGHVPPSLAEPLGLIAARRPVVLTSRTGSGSVLSRTYGAIGSESDLIGRGLIRGGFLDPFKARTLLRVLLAADADRDTIVNEFAVRGQ